MRTEELLLGSQILSIALFFLVQKNGSVKTPDDEVEDHIVRIARKKKEMINVEAKTRPIDPHLVCSSIMFHSS